MSDGAHTTLLVGSLMIKQTPASALPLEKKKKTKKEILNPTHQAHLDASQFSTFQLLALKP